MDDPRDGMAASSMQSSIMPYQEVDPTKKFDILMQAMCEYTPKIPPLLIQKILEEIGLESSDEETYKMIGMLSDKFLDDVMNSIHQSKYVQMEKRSKKDKKHTREEYSKFLTIDLIQQLKQQGLKISETYLQPHHTVTAKKEDK